MSMEYLEPEALDLAIERHYHSIRTDAQPRRFGVTAFKQGWQAGIRGLHSWENPYPDKRTDRGNVTFSRAYRLRWLYGWRAALLFLHGPEEARRLEEFDRGLGGIAAGTHERLSR